MGLTVEVITFHCIGDTPTRIHLRNSCFVLYLILFINVSFHSVEAGLCWSAPNRNDRCTDLLRKDITEDQCCSGAESANTGITSTAYSEDLTSGQLFYYRALRGGVPCATCKATCEGFQCDTGKMCVLKGDERRPVCICAPKCSRRKRRLGPVCGSDGRTYRHVCRLLKRKCRKDSTLTVDYYGSCEDSCDSVRCTDSKKCILDHNMKPHCVRCKNHCPPVSANSRSVCDVNNVTYSSYCHLQRAVCLSASAIQVAYRGHCKRMYAFITSLAF